MEIVLAQTFNLEAAIDTAYGDWNAKQQLLAISQKEAEQRASEILLAQFQSQFNDVITTEIQTALQAKVVINSEAFMLEVYAIFKYCDVTCCIKRHLINNATFWKINHQEQEIICFPDSLQKQLLIELGSIKRQSLS